MLSIYKTNKEKLEENILLFNIIFDINNMSSQRAYPKKYINDIINSLEEDNIDEVINLIFKYNINLKENISINYRKLQLFFKHGLDLTNFKEYDLLKKELNIFFKENKDFAIFYLQNSYKNSNKKKGNLFKNILNYIFINKNNFKNKTILNNIDFYNNINDIKVIIDDKDFIYIPETDQQVIEAMKYFNKDISFSKGRDILIRFNMKYYIGEAKEIDETGGSQNNQFKDILKCISEFNTKDVIGFGIIYGACTLTSNIYQEEIDINKKIIPLSEFIFNLENSLFI